MDLKNIAGSIAACCLLAGAASAQAPHQHGHGAVNIVIEQDRVEIELHAPGADVVGFERPPQTDAERQILSLAKAALQQPLTLLTLPAAARCTVQDAVVAAEGMEEGAPAGAHAEFEAAWMLRCVDISALRTFDFKPLFTRFAGAEELDVTVVTARGPSTYEVDRDRPTVDRGNSLWRWLTGR